MTRSDNLQTQIDAITRQLARLTELHTAAKALETQLPERDPAIVGDVIRWIIRFQPEGIEYRYAAILAGNGHWYTTARHDRSDANRVFYNWADLRAHLIEQQATSVEFAAGWATPDQKISTEEEPVF